MESFIDFFFHISIGACMGFGHLALWPLQRSSRYILIAVPFAFGLVTMLIYTFQGIEDLMFTAFIKGWVVGVSFATVSFCFQRNRLSGKSANQKETADENRE